MKFIFDNLFIYLFRNLNLYPNDAEITANLSPRSKYLRRITRENLTPMPLLLRKETVFIILFIIFLFN